MFNSVYVDNFFIIDEDLNVINSPKKKLLKHFCMTEIGTISHYLSVFVIWTRNSMSLDQKSYLEKDFLQFQMDTCKPASLLIDSGVSNSMLPTPANQQADKNTIF